MLIEPAPHIVQPRTVTGFYAAPARSQKRRWKETAGARESLFRASRLLAHKNQRFLHSQHCSSSLRMNSPKLSCTVAPGIQLAKK